MLSHTKKSLSVQSEIITCTSSGGPGGGRDLSGPAALYITAVTHKVHCLHVIQPELEDLHHIAGPRHGWTGRPLPHLPKLGAGHGCEKQSVSDTGDAII